MNFRERLTNVLTASSVIMWGLMLFNRISIYGMIKLMHVPMWLLKLGACVLVVAGISFLMGTGFKAWHKSVKA